MCLDLLLERQPYALEAAKVFAHFSRSGAKAFVSAPTFLNLHYFLRKQYGEKPARSALDRFRAEVEILAVNEKMIQKALASKFSDLEDAVQHQCALMNKMTMIVTRNSADFSESDLPVLSPKKFLVALKPPFST